MDIRPSERFLCALHRKMPNKSDLPDEWPAVVAAAAAAGAPAVQAHACRAAGALSRFIQLYRSIGWGR